MNGLIILLHLITILFLMALSWTDIKARVISNKIVLGMLMVIIPLAWMKYGQINLFPAFIVLVVGFFLFTFHLIGAGDVKLISVLVLAIPTEQLLYFFFFTTFSGLLLIVFGWLFYRQSIRQNGLPYGVAISLGFLFNLVLFS